MFQDTRPAPLPQDSLSDPWHDFRIGDPLEIERLMRQLRDQSVPMHISAPDGTHVTTTLWTVDAGLRRISFAADQSLPQLQGLVEGEEASVVAYLDSVKLQFELEQMMLVHAARSSALQAAWPAPVYRFQRREAFRVRTPDRQTAVARLRHPALPDMMLELRVVDVSIGGCALAVPLDVPPLQPGCDLAGVRVELDADTHFVATLQVHHVTAFQPGDAPVRLGCGWLRLDGAAQRGLQRYIDQTQKRRRLLSAGRG